LFDLDEDVREQRDVASEHAELAERLTRMLRDNHEPAPPQIEPAAPDGRYYR
jgi:hypothetical protein